MRGLAWESVFGTVEFNSRVPLVNRGCPGRSKMPIVACGQPQPLGSLFEPPLGVGERIGNSQAEPCHIIRARETCRVTAHFGQTGAV